jgi:predicted aspartyl protease
MGLTHINILIANPRNPKRTRKLSLLVDSGAVYSIVPKTVLSALGVKPHSSKIFTLADGSEIKRDVGDLVFKLNGHQGASPVIFGKKETARC